MIRREDLARYTDNYFLNSRAACDRAGVNPRVVYQVFQRANSILCGVKFVLELFSNATDNVQIFGLNDGDAISPVEPVLHLVGPVTELIEYETVYLGMLARMTRIATNVREAVEAANGKPVLFFPARFDVPEAQEYDGYAAKIGGAFGASTAEEAKAFRSRAVGTMPHALIAAFRGDVVAAALALAQSQPNEPFWALVDFHNDCVRDSLAVFHAFRDRGLKLSGVRADTSQDVVDASLQRKGMEVRGVQPELVIELRRALDEAGANDVKISVSGGFTAEKIRSFEEKKVPVDVYAIGERFFRGSVPFTSDVVAVFDGDQLVKTAKFGREYRENSRFRRLR